MPFLTSFCLGGGGGLHSSWFGLRRDRAGPILAPVLCGGTPKSVRVNSCDQSGEVLDSEAQASPFHVCAAGRGVGYCDCLYSDHDLRDQGSSGAATFGIAI